MYVNAFCDYKSSSGCMCVYVGIYVYIYIIDAVERCKGVGVRECFWCIRECVSQKITAGECMYTLMHFATVPADLVVRVYI